MSLMRWLLAVAGVCLVPLFPLGEVRADSKADWAKETYTSAKKERLPYRLFEPAKGDPQKGYSRSAIGDSARSWSKDYVGMVCSGERWSSESSRRPRWRSPRCWGRSRSS